MPEDVSGSSRLLVDPDQADVSIWMYMDWAPWRSVEDFFPASLEPKRELPDPERFGMSGSKFKSTAFYRAIQTMGEAEQEEQEGSPPQAIGDEDSPEAAIYKAASRLREAVSHLEPLRGEHSGNDNLDPVSDFIGEDTGNLTGARKTLQDLLTGDHEVAGVIAENLAEWMQENQDTLAEGAANHLANLLLSYYMQEVAATIHREAEEAVGGENQTAEAMGAGKLSGEELIGVPSSRKDGDLEDLQWEGPHPAPCRNLVDEYLEGRSFEGCASFIAYHISVTLARDAFEAVEGATPSDGEIESYVQGCSGETLFKYAARVATRTVGFAVLECLEDEGLSADWIEGLLGAGSEETPAQRSKTPEWKRSPFQGGQAQAAGMVSGPFILRSTRALSTAKEQPAPSGKGDWIQGPTGRPVYVDTFGGNPYDGTVTFTVRAAGDATAADMDASLAWAMLDEIGPRVVWGHMYLLAHASDPARRGSREWMGPINPIDFEHALGLRRSKKNTAAERYREVQSVVKALTSIYVKFQNLDVQGRKAEIRGDGVERPLWNLELPTVAEVDMFDGSADVNWYLRAMEGAWADEFLHGREKPPLAWLPEDYFERRDGRRKFVRRLVPYLLFLFRAGSKNGNRARLSAEEMLRICGVDLTQKRSSSQRSRLKNQILTALSQLEEVYGINVRDPNGVRQKYIPWGDWKGRTAHFHPPEEIDGLLLRQEKPKPELPEVSTRNWTSSQISRLRKEVLGGPPEWTQAKLAEKLGCTKQYVSQLERGKKNNPSREIRETLTRLYHRHK